MKILVNYCVECGEDGSEKFTLKALTEKIIDWLGWEKNFFRTSFLLLFYPKRVLTDCLHGKTKNYHSPLLISALATLLNGLILEHYEPIIFFEDGTFLDFLSLGFLSIVFLCVWALQQITFFYKFKWGIKKHIYIVLVTFSILILLTLIKNIIVYLFLGDIFGLKINYANDWVYLVQSSLVMYYVYIPFSLIKIKWYKKIMLFSLYAFLILFEFLLLQVSLMRLYPERDLGNIANLKAKPLVMKNECFEDITLAVAYQNDIGRWEQLDGIVVKAYDKRILIHNGDTIKLSTPVLYSHAKGQNTDIEWPGNKLILVGRREYLAREIGLISEDGRYILSYTCEESLLKKEQNELIEKVGDMEPGFKYQIKDSTHTYNGVEIAYIYRNLPAERAGLEKKDVIIQVDTLTISDGASLQAAFDIRSSDTLTVEYLRLGQRLRTQLILEVYNPNN